MYRPISNYWRVRERRSFTDDRFYIDCDTSPGMGKLSLIAEGLSCKNAHVIVKAHNLTLDMSQEERERLIEEIFNAAKNHHKNRWTD